ncbi:hypothetical protein LJR029_000086 [Caballeronia sp. LjRoot29]|uniref:hypothetical protein n=1 Tax=Caballeronia sp. LjRoot29 TaxID=3342315 RepID=UPI003ECD05FC
MTKFDDFDAKFLLNSSKEHVCCIAQKPVLSYYPRGFPTGRSANEKVYWGPIAVCFDGLAARVSCAVSSSAQKRRNAGLPRSLPRFPHDPSLSKQAINEATHEALNNCQRQQYGAIDELHAGPEPAKT